MRSKRLWFILLVVCVGVLGVLIVRRRTERDLSRLVVRVPAPAGARLSLDGFTSDGQRLIITAQTLTPPDKVDCRTWLLDLRTRRLQQIYQGSTHPVPQAVWKDRILFSDGNVLQWVRTDGAVEEPFYRAPRDCAARGVAISKRGKIAFCLTAGKYPSQVSNVWLIEPDGKAPRPLTRYTGQEQWSLSLPRSPRLMWSPDGDRLAFYESGVIITPRGRVGRPRLVILHLVSGKAEKIKPSQLQLPVPPWNRWRMQVVKGKGYMGVVRKKEGKEGFVPISEVIWQTGQIPRGGKTSPDQRKRLLFMEDNPDALATPQIPVWDQILQRLTGRRISTRRMTRPPLPWTDAFYETSQLWLLTDEGQRRLLVKKYQNPLWSPDSQRVYFTRRHEVRVVDVE